jgi:hypothetical protein
VAWLTETLEVSLVVEIINVATMTCDVYTSRHDVVDHPDRMVAAILSEFVTEPDVQAYCISASVSVILAFAKMGKLRHANSNGALIQPLGDKPACRSARLVQTVHHIKVGKDAEIVVDI